MTTAKAHHTALDAAALAAVLDTWRRQPHPPTVLALLPEAEKDRLPTLQAACRERGLDLCGAIFPALIADARFVTQGAWLLPVTAPWPPFLIDDLVRPDGAARIADAVGDRLADHPAPTRPTLLMILDGMLPDIASQLDDLYLRLADRVDYAGANAGSETFRPMPCLFDADRVIGSGVLGILLEGGMAPFAIEHGYPVPDRLAVATATRGNCIASIDWRPAFDVYQELIFGEYGVRLTRDNFYQYAVHFPFGIPRATGDAIVRIPVGLADDGAIFCVGEVPENAMLTLMRAPDLDNPCVARIASRLEPSAASTDDPLLLFYCAGRRLHLGPAAEQELAALAGRLGARTMAGALSLGEIGSGNQDYPVFHNAALVGRYWR